MPENPLLSRDSRHLSFETKVTTMSLIEYVILIFTLNNEQ